MNRLIKLITVTVILSALNISVYADWVGDAKSGNTTAYMAISQGMGLNGGNQPGSGGGGSGGSGSSYGSQGPSKDDVGKSLFSKAMDSLRNFLSNLKDSVYDAMQSLIGKTKESVEGMETDADAVDEEAETENTEGEDSESSKKNSDLAGDPVSIATGEYVQNNSDVEISGLFSVERTYRSGNTMAGSFGLGWSTNLDERIIFGLSGAEKKILNKLEENRAFYNWKYGELSNAFYNEYHVSSVGGARGEIEVRIRNDKEYLKSAQDAIDAAEMISSYSRGNRLNEAQEKYNEIKNDIAVCEKILNDLDSQVRFVNELSTKINEANQKTGEYFLKLEKDKSIASSNQKALRKGVLEIFQKTGTDTLTIIDGKGIPHRFRSTQSDEWLPDTSDERIYKSIKKDKNGGFTVLQCNGCQKTFSESGLITRIEDRNGNYVNFTRNPDGDVSKIISSRNEEFDIESKDGHIVKITNIRDESDITLYSYDQNLLVSYTDNEKYRSEYIYTGEKKLCEIQKPDGSSVSFTYGEKDSDQNILVAKTTTEEGYFESFVYNKKERITEYINHRGEKTTYWYDENKRTVKEVLPDGSTIEYEYDDKGNVIERKVNGNPVQYSYDSNGNKTRTLYSDGAFEEWQYNDFSEIEKFRDRDGVVFEIRRDLKGNVIALIRGGIPVRDYEYNSSGLLVKETVHSSEEEVTVYQYDKYGNVVSRKKNGLTETFTYDNRNRITEAAAGDLYKETREYTASKVKIACSNGMEYIYDFSVRKDLTKITEHDTVEKRTICVEYEYDKSHHPVKEYVLNGKDRIKIREWAYDEEGELICEKVFDEDSVYVNEFTRKNGFISASSFYEAGEANKKIENFYSREILFGDRKKITKSDGRGRTTEYLLDANNKICSEEDLYGTLTKKNYSAAGRLLSEENEFGGVTEYSYSSPGFYSSKKEQYSKECLQENWPDGKIRSFRNSKGELYEYFYNASGLLSSIRNQSKTVWFEYDVLGRITLVLYGNTPEKSTAVRYVEYSYSENGRKRTECNGGLYYTTKVYDGFGKLIKKTDGEENSIRYAYDYRNHLSSVTDSYGNITHYKYNVYNQPSRVDFSDGTFRNYEYDFMGNCIRISNEAGTEWEGEYNEDGLLVKEKAYGDVQKSYRYDERGRLIQSSTENRIDQKISFHDSGREIRILDGNGNLYKISRDKAGRILSEENREHDIKSFSYGNDGSLGELYDLNGNRIVLEHKNSDTYETVSYPDGSETRFLYDMCGNLIEADNGKNKLRYSYNKAGLLEEYEDTAVGEKVFYSYDRRGKLVSVKGGGRNISYTRGKSGELLCVKDFSSRLSVEFEYDIHGRETKRIFGNGFSQENFFNSLGNMELVVVYDQDKEVSWAEGYLYNQEGKISGKINHKGEICLYEYNSVGSLSAVYYPETPDFLALQRNEAEKNGLYMQTEPLPVNKYLSASQLTGFNKLLSRMKNSYGKSVSPLQVFLFEKFEYDKNGNRITKETVFGKLEYSYDSENRLLSIGTPGSPFVNFVNDRNGNLLKKTSPLEECDYVYDFENRLTSVNVRDIGNGSVSSRAFRYDALGRRNAVMNDDGIIRRKLYDGFSFDVLKEGPCFAGGTFTDKYAPEGPWEEASSGGERYRHLNDASSKSRYAMLDSADSESEDFTFFLKPLNVNGQPVAVRKDDDLMYFGKDNLGSVRNISFHNANDSVPLDYDAFGSAVNSFMVFQCGAGYNSKQYDKVSEFYNYGFRDYASSLGRFSSMDPIRDGHNWFVYTNSDPVNFYDPNGLFFYKVDTQVAYKDTTIYIIRDNDGTGNEFNSSLFIRKEDVFGNITFSKPYLVGANCKEEYDGKKGSTTPDGSYFLSDDSTYDTPLYKQSDGSTNSTSFKNVLSLRTKDPNFTQEQRDMINKGDRLFHADEWFIPSTGETHPYNKSGTPGGAGCIINHTQSEHDEMMTEIMEGVPNPEDVKVNIHSLNNMGCDK